MINTDINFFDDLWPAPTALPADPRRGVALSALPGKPEMPLVIEKPSKRLCYYWLTTARTVFLKLYKVLKNKYRKVLIFSLYDMEIVMNLDKDLYIRFMSPVTPFSTERLLTIIDTYLRQGIERIHLLINSPGGSVTHGLAIYNFLKGIPIEIITHNFGTVDSIGVILYCAGVKRFAVPQARFLLHPVLVNFLPNAQMDEHALKEVQNGLLTDQENIAKVIAATVAKPSEEIMKSIHSRTTLNSTTAEKFGLVQKIQDVLIPTSDVLFEVVKESESNPPPHPFLGHPVAIQNVPMSAAPSDSQTNVYRSVGFFNGTGKFA